MTTDAMIEVLKAFSHGELIEVADAGKTNWAPTVNPTWNFDRFDYRAEMSYSEWVKFQDSICTHASALTPRELFVAGYKAAEKKMTLT